MGAFSNQTWYEGFLYLNRIINELNIMQLEHQMFFLYFKF